MKTEKTKKEIWVDFTVYHKTNGFDTHAEVDSNSIYLDFKAPISPPTDLTFKGPFPYAMRYSSDDILGFQYEDKKDAWEIFYEHATFNEILESTEEHSIDMPKDTFYETRERVTYGEFKAQLSEYYKRVLQAARNNPEIPLISDKLGSALLHFLKIARYSIDRKKANEARNVIKDCLLPDFKKHRRYALPSSEIFRLMRRLLIKLATHLSAKCKSALKEYINDEHLTNRDIRNEWKGCYHHILTWSQENDGRIYEIADESERSTKSLIITPSSYVNSAIATYYQISIRTLKSIK